MEHHALGDARQSAVGVDVLVAEIKIELGSPHVLPMSLAGSESAPLNLAGGVMRDGIGIEMAPPKSLAVGAMMDSVA
ncbi:hypothetical protein TRAPUB_13992, partial [Trametes pubescens]